MKIRQRLLPRVSVTLTILTFAAGSLQLAVSAAELEPPRRGPVPSLVQATAFPSVVVHNLMLLPSGFTDWEPDARAALVGNSSHLRDPDLLVLTELFDNSATDDQLFPRLGAHHPYRTPVIGRGSAGWNRTSGGYFGSPLEDGGVAILSRYPIRYRAQHIFGGGCGADWWSAKGFAYVKVDMAGSLVHLIGTHLQADDDGCDAGEAVAERARQLRAIDAYLRALAIPSSQPVLIAGDLNIRYGTAEYLQALTLLHAATPNALPGHPTSYDPSTNSVAAYRAPGGRSTRLDYVLLRAGHVGPPSGWISQVLPVHSASFRMRNRTFSDYSDHYAVLGRPAPIR